MTSTVTSPIVSLTLWLLLLFSVVTWSIVVRKGWLQLQLSRLNQQFHQHFWKAPDLTHAESLATSSDGPLARLARAAIRTADAIRTAAVGSRVGRVETREGRIEILAGLQINIPTGLPAPQDPIQPATCTAQEALIPAHRERPYRVAEHAVFQHECVVGLLYTPVELVLNHLAAEGVHDPLPAEVPIGTYQVEIKLFSAGTFVTKTETAFEIVKVGFEQFVATTARQNGLIYGLVTAAMALMTGWMASIVFRKD